MAKTGTTLQHGKPAAGRRSAASNDNAPRKGRPRVHVDPDAIRALFCFPQPRAAVALGISLTALKTLCRQNGIERWPYRRGVAGGDPGQVASGGGDMCSDSDCETHDCAQHGLFSSKRTGGCPNERTSSVASSDWSRCSSEPGCASSLACSDQESADPDSSASDFDNFDEALSILSTEGQWVEWYAREATEMLGAGTLVSGALAPWPYVPRVFV